MRELKWIIGILLCFVLVAVICFGILMKKQTVPTVIPQTPIKSITSEEETRRVPTEGDRERFAEMFGEALKSGQVEHDNQGSAWAERSVWKKSSSVGAEGSDHEILSIWYDEMSLVMAEHLLHANLSGYYHHHTLMEEAKELGFKKIVFEAGRSEDEETWTWDLINEKYEIKGNVSER